MCYLLSQRLYCTQNNEYVQISLTYSFSQLTRGMRSFTKHNSPFFSSFRISTQSLSHRHTPSIYYIISALYLAALISIHILVQCMYTSHARHFPTSLHSRPVFTPFSHATLTYNGLYLLVHLLYIVYYYVFFNIDSLQRLKYWLDQMFQIVTM